METFSYSYVKYTPRVACLLLKVEIIELENFDFVFFSFLLFLLSLVHQAQLKKTTTYTSDPHVIKSLLSQIFLFLVRAASVAKTDELWPKTRISVAILCIITNRTRKLKVV